MDYDTFGYEAYFGDAEFTSAVQQAAAAAQRVGQDPAAAAQQAAEGWHQADAEVAWNIQQEAANA